MKDIFRKYPSTYEGVIPILCSNLDELDEPEAKASLIWIIGEYANTIDNADELLGIFVDSFTEESYPVQLQTLTAVVKLFLKKPDSSQGIVQKVLNTATKDWDSPDVRDRAYIHWRLLSMQPRPWSWHIDLPFLFLGPQWHQRFWRSSSARLGVLPASITNLRRHLLEKAELEQMQCERLET
jgi:hypothetical protein